MASKKFRTCLIISMVIASGCCCGFPGAPAHSTVTLSDDSRKPGTVATYICDRGFELLGPARKICSENATWTPPGIPFCVLNVAAGKAPMQSSLVGNGIPQKAVDGSTATAFNTETCTQTQREKNPWWYVNVLEPYMVQLVRLDFGLSCCGDHPAVIEVRVGNNRPDLRTNPICNRFEGYLEEGRPLFLPCSPPMPGAFISVHFVHPTGVELSICEAFVYTDQALPIERCPSFRDQPPGSTATYNGKCYIFYSQQPKNFDDALEFCRSRGGSLLDETNPALQGFLSWELWRRHRGDPTGQYWLGAVRDPLDHNNWKWINGLDVTVSFWNLPGGNENCARFDGTTGWLWSDTNCLAEINFICQHRPTTCGKPEQPPNSTMIAPNFEVGSEVTYVCDEGHALIGPGTRKCLNSGFFDEFPPNCQYVRCGTAAPIRNGHYLLVNGTSYYMSLVRYSCESGFVIVGRSELMCDFDGRWNGPPPRCEPRSPLKPDLSEVDLESPQDGVPYDTNFVDIQGDDSNPKVFTVLPPVDQETGGQDVSLRNNRGPAVDRPDYAEDRPGPEVESAKIPLGGIIPLGVLGGLVFLAAVVTTIVILVKRSQSSSNKKYMRRHDDTTASSDSSSSDGHGLNKYYKRAWENLEDGVPPLRESEKEAAHLRRGDGGEPSDFRSTRSIGQEGLRDGSEMTVNDVTAMYTKPEKRRHHHHRHNHRHKSHEREVERDDSHGRDRRKY